MNRSAALLSQQAWKGAAQPLGCVRTTLAVQSSASTTRREYSLAQLKRTKQRRLWISKDDPNIGPDADFYLPDREGLGCDPELNFTLHKYKITPSQEAFRNLHLRGLVMLAEGKTDKSKALHVPVASDSFTVYYGEKAPAFDTHTKVLNLNQYKRIVKEIKDHLSDTASIVVHDGAIGSHPSCEVRARIVTDDPAAALYLHHVVPRVSIGNVKDFEHAVTAYIVPKFKPTSLAEFGITSDSYVIVDVVRGIVIVGGPMSTSAIRAGLVAVAQPRFFVDRSSVPLNASVVGLQGTEKPILVFGNHDLVLNNELGLDVFGGHNVAWSSEGVVRFFDGVTFPVAKDSKLSRGDLVEELNGVSRATVRKSSANVHSHPSALVFLVEDASHVLPTLSKVSPDYVSQFLLAGYAGQGKSKQPFKPLFADSITADPHGITAKVGELVKENKVDVFVVNVAAKDKPLSNAQLSSVLKAVASGNTKDAPVLSNVFSKISPITSIKGLDLPLDPTKRGWELSSLKTEASKLEKSISDYLAANFTPPPPPSPPQQPQQAAPAPQK